MLKPRPELRSVWGTGGGWLLLVGTLASFAAFAAFAALASFAFAVVALAIASPAPFCRVVCRPLRSCSIDGASEVFEVCERVQVDLL